MADVTWGNGNYDRALGAVTTRVVTVAAVKVQNNARRNAPVDTGTLRRSVTHTITGSGVGSVARVGSNLEYALWVETGTGVFGPKGKPIEPRTARYLRFPANKGRGFIYARRVSGRRATPYLVPALRSLV